ncbi:staphylopine uptake ABC transporter ATP-binding protein CntD [Ureibacillus sinduriensis]|uniref:Peptide ABC transporter ATP-binding protein n=1 Tax=Ureibacillus sinduriensis BLB-1 = JCM 15800 TaxID=1384057 RepID=A0A0A3I0D7_9BACL|nr:ABC transporter ATP-binding protein [Ureibacillus sinduriensis]KGR76975.1 peptide ABC transporter ATP-binding protein [Ureibacillus sinduriensis BLB-1 = JCM 15800]
MALLEVNNLRVWDAHTKRVIVHNTSFTLEEGKCLAIVGESGSGKSVTCRALAQLNKKSLCQDGEIHFRNERLQILSEKQMRKKRGKNFCMILQNGMTAFDPSCKIKVHLFETLKTHLNWEKKRSERKMIQAMESVNLKNAKEIMNKYPHQLSGGMLQRIMIALALALEPDIIIADEPTTALDTISQCEVMEQLRKIRLNMNCAIILVSHDLGVVRNIADEVLVMKEGKVLEKGDTPSVFANPAHDYTKYLIKTRSTISDNFIKLMERSNLVKS